MDTITIILYAVTGAAIIGCIVLYIIDRRTPADLPGLVLPTMYMRGDVQPMAKGMVHGWPYNFMVSNMPQQTLSDAGDGPIQYYGTFNGAINDAVADVAKIAMNINARDHAKLTMLVQLPSNSSVHIVAIGTMSGEQPLTATKLLANRLQESRLEGNFPDYFHLYCSYDQQVELRQVLDPAAMQFLIDFCREYDWELYGDALYIFERDNNPNAGKLKDDTTMLTDVEGLGHYLDPVLARFKREQTMLKRG